MLRSEIMRFCRRPVVWTFVGMMIVLAAWDGWQAGAAFVQTPYLETKLLLASTSSGHIAMIAMFWLLPIYYFILCSEPMLRDKEQGITKIELTRSSRRRYLSVKVGCGAVFVTFTYAVAMLVNAVVVRLVVPTQTVKIEQDMLELFVSWQHMGNWVYAHRAVTYGLYVLMALTIVLCLGILINTVVMLIPDRKVAYPILLVYWLLWWLSKFDLSMAMQPFTEYGLSYGIVTWLGFNLIAGVIIGVVTRRLMRHDHL